MENLKHQTQKAKLELITQKIKELLKENQELKEQNKILSDYKDFVMKACKKALKIKS